MVMGAGIRDMQHTVKELFPNRISTNPNPPFLDILSSGTNLDEDSHDDDAFSDLALTYVSQMLMDEDDKVDSFHDYAAIQATERPFYEILGQKYPPPPPPIHSPNFYDFTEYHPTATCQFIRGEEEARKFLPSEDKLVLGSRGRKNRHGDDSDDKRSSKHSAVSDEAIFRSDVSDDPLLCHGDNFSKVINDIREAYRIGPNKKKQRKKDVVDLRTVLIQCAQMAAADDPRSTSELLKQIRQSSSPAGDGSQRLAHYFANGLEARLAGTGTEIYNLIKQKRRTAADYLKAYRLYLAVCPFKKISYYFSNQHILDVSENATRVHVVDYGIGFGFQWPSLIQRMSFRANGPPKLRITGIDLPQPGFRPRDRLDETGRRLADYATHFNVPFEYRGISSRWEDISIEDLGVDRDEVLVVNCLYMFRHVADETVAVESPRNTVLNTIRKMNPDIFIHGVLNGSYSAPFFVTRFREALFFFSAIFDMLETNVPREDELRQLIEREIFGREIMNIVACEGLERVERPETYKQWQVRIARARFVQRPLSKDMLKKVRDKVKECYHKDFIIDEDSRWLIQGWKGRILSAISSWQPNNSL